MHRQGSSNRLIYDNCSYFKELKETTLPGTYRLYGGKYENCNKCVFDKFYRRFDLVDVESELRNITRLTSNCHELKYNPNCKKSKNCLSTFDTSNPIVLSHDICPIVYNNIPKQSYSGFNNNGLSSCK